MVYGDQFMVGGLVVVVECGVLSVDYLEVSGFVEVEMLVQIDMILVVLLGVIMGLGCDWGKV